jgi:hypothetical protein
LKKAADVNQGDGLVIKQVPLFTAGDHLTPHHGKKLMDIEFPMPLMVIYDVAGVTWATACRGLSPISNIFIPM